MKCKLMMNKLYVFTHPTDKTFSFEIFGQLTKTQLNKMICSLQGNYAVKEYMKGDTEYERFIESDHS